MIKGNVKFGDLCGPHNSKDPLGYADFLKGANE